MFFKNQLQLKSNKEGNLVSQDVDLCFKKRIRSEIIVNLEIDQQDELYHVFMIKCCSV